MRRKLKSRSGETLAETLAAVLIAGLASVALLTMILSAVRINTRADGADEAFYAALSAAETDQRQTGTVEVKVGGDPVVADLTGTADLPAYRVQGGAGA